MFQGLCKNVIPAKMCDPNNQYNRVKAHWFHYYNFKRHEAICGINNVKKIKCVQTTYGDDYNVLKEMADDGYIPCEAIEYRNFDLCTYDIETIEIPYQNCAPDRGMIKEATHRLLSIAVGSNMVWLCSSYQKIECLMKLTIRKSP